MILHSESAVSAAQPDLSGDWPTYGKGPDHTGYFPGRLNNAAFVFKWGAPIPNGYLSQAAIAEGRVFVSSGHPYGNSLIALDANTGQALWTNYLMYEGGHPSAPSYNAGSVFVQQYGYAPQSQLWSLDATNGSTNWMISMALTNMLRSAPVVADGRVFVEYGYDRGIGSYDQVTGAQQWSLPGLMKLEWALSYYQGKIYSWHGSFAERSASTGNVNWELPNELSGVFLSDAVAIAGGRAYCVGEKLYCVDLNQHTVLWSTNVAAGYPLSGPPTVANGMVYIELGNSVRAYTTNGSFVRSYSTGEAGLKGQIIVTDDILIVQTVSIIYVFRLADGFILQVKSALSFGDFQVNAMSLANNTLYISGKNGVYAYEARMPSPIALREPEIGANGYNANGMFRFNFTNLPGASFTVWASTNLDLPANQWRNLGRPEASIIGSYGYYWFSDTNAAAETHQFYRVSWP